VGKVRRDNPSVGSLDIVLGESWVADVATGKGKRKLWKAPEDRFVGLFQPILHVFALLTKIIFGVYQRRGCEALVFA